MAERPDPDAFVELGPPRTTVAWSNEFVIQSIEPLFVHLASDEARYLRPQHAESLQLGLSPNDQPGQIVLDAAARYALTPRLVHSTSWRFQEARVVMTYVAVVETPVTLSHFLVDEPVRQTELARGDAFAPPPAIEAAMLRFVLASVQHLVAHVQELQSASKQIRGPKARPMGQDVLVEQESLADRQPGLQGPAPTNRFARLARRLYWQTELSGPHGGGQSASLQLL
jgi:hypothetical protein